MNLLKELMINIRGLVASDENTSNIWVTINSLTEYETN